MHRLAIPSLVLLLALAPLAAEEAPPLEAGRFRAPDLVELTRLDPTIKLDVRYATAIATEASPISRRPVRWMIATDVTSKWAVASIAIRSISRSAMPE